MEMERAIECTECTECTEDDRMGELCEMRFAVHIGNRKRINSTSWEIINKK